LNYSGKFDAKLPFDPGAPHHPHIHVDSVSAHGAPVGAIIVPDAQLLFNGDFKRSGVDLILSRDDRELVLQDYFKGEKRAALSSPDGAHLTGDIIDALTGHQQFAQAGGGASAGKVIGHLTKLIGSASAIRNGVSIILNNGDNVEKGDVVQSGSGSTVGITFIDGTVFGLSSNARMVLNEMVYDPNGSNNSSLLSLVAGTISFVAGETAKHGDMKVDTPVATMGIRGTAVLVEIDFDVPGQGGAPAAKFQVLVEPDGTTGRYVLFDKLTLAPIATVDQAGVVKSLSQGILTSYSAPLSPDVQKLITDVFALKFTDNTNTKTQNHQFTDSIVPQTFQQFKLADGATAVPVFVNVPTPAITATPGPTGPADANPHIPGAPFVVAFDGPLIEAIGVTHSSAIDTVSNIIRFADLNAGDTPTVQTKFDSFIYQDAQHNDVTKTLNAQQLADIAAVEANLLLVPDPGNKNTGSVTWTYSMVDSAFDFIGDGETLTLTYNARVDNNFAPNNETAFKSFTITITRGSNDVPTIVSALTTATGAVTEDAAATLTASGKITYQDVDLTDTHTAAFVLKSSDANANLPGYSVSAPLSQIGTFALGAVNENNADTINIGSVGWSFTLDDSNPVLQSLAAGQTITQVYTVTVSDGHGGTVSQDVTVTITGTNDAPTIVAVSTSASGGVTEDSNVVSGSLVTSGTIGFQDVDLIDTHTASFVVKSTDAAADLPGFAEGNGPGAAHIGTFALTAVSEDNTDTTNTASLGWSFTLDDGNPVLQSLAVGQTITQVYTVTVSDGHGGTVSQDVTVTITGTNDAPTIVADSTSASGGVTEDNSVVSGSLVTSGTIAFNDVDLIDTHTTSVMADDGNTLGGTLTMGAVSESAGTAAGTVGWTYTVADNATDYLAAGQTATEKFTVTIADGHGGTVAQVVTITVTGTNEAPDIHVVPTDSAAATLTETNAGLSICGTLTVDDADLADTVSSSVTTVAASGAITGLGLTNEQLLAMLSVAPTSGLAADPGDSHNLTWTFNSGTQAFNYLAASQSLVLTYTVKSMDSSASPLSDTQSATVTINGTNDAPAITAQDLIGAVTEHASAVNLSDSGTISFTDVDLTDVHLVSATGTPIGTTLGTLTAVKNADTTGTGTGGQLTWSYTVADSAIEYLAAGETKVESFTITLDDQHGGLITKQIDVTITGTNDAASITGTATGAVKEDGTLTAAGTLTVADVDSGEAHFQTPASLTATHGVFTFDPSTGVWGYTLNNGAANVQSLADGQVVHDTLTVKSADGTASQQIDVTITGTNDVAVISGTSSGTVVEAGGVANATPGIPTATGTLTDTDVDNAPNTFIAAEAGSATDHGYGTYQMTAAGVWTYTLNDSNPTVQALNTNQHLTDTFTIHSADGTAQIVTVSINGTNDAAVISGKSSGSVEVADDGPGSGKLTDTGTLTDTDVDNAPNTFIPAAAGSATDHGYGTYQMTAAGVWTYTLNSSNRAVKALDEGDHLTDTFTVHTVDGTARIVTVTINDDDPHFTRPAGVAGSEINLGLAAASPDPGVLVTVTIADLPSGWSLKGGVQVDDHTWTMQTSDVQSLTVIPSSASLGAVVLEVSESWTKPDGGTASALVVDNLESYAVGSPIFALAANDYLTGSSGSDLFVFAQPISHDVIYSFDAVSDKIDLVGFSGFSDFNDVAAHLSDDGVGNTVLTLASDETITLHGVSSASLSAGNFQFNQQTVLENSADMIIGNGAALPLSGLIENTGVIELNSTGGETDLQLIQSGATLHGGGQIVLSDSDANIISGTSSSVTLNNEDNTISGAGQLGNGELSLANAGTINATGNHVLDIDTGSNIVLNSGVLEASGSGGMTVASAVANSGILWANGATLTLQGAVSGNGTATIDGTGTLDFEASSTANVAFGSGAAGTLKLGDSFNFNGTISGFEGSDMIDLANLGSANASISYHENAAGTGGTLAISDGAQTVELSLLGKYSADNFSFVPDHVHGILVTYVPLDLVV
jgi:VCBS repeat-containing protein